MVMGSTISTVLDQEGNVGLGIDVKEKIARYFSLYSAL
jgi:hypothetical protein